MKTRFFLSILFLMILPISMMSISGTAQNSVSITPADTYSSGGGYTMSVYGTYSWEEISGTGTLLSTISQADDAYQTIYLTNWDITFYESSYYYIYVSSNGYMSFTDSTPSSSSASVPSSSDDDNVLLCSEDLDDGDVYYEFFGTSPNRYLIIEYYHTELYSSTNVVGTFQVIFYENGDITFMIQNMYYFSSFSPEMGLDHGDNTNYNSYTPSLPISSKAIEFEFDEMDIPASDIPPLPFIPGADLVIIFMVLGVGVVCLSWHSKKKFN